MKGNDVSFRLDLLKEAVAWAETSYETASKITARLEDKAQQTGGVAGLFLAAAFGFLKPEKVAGAANMSNGLTAFLLINVVVVFLLCLAACLSVFWLQNAPIPLSLPLLMGMNDDLLRLPADRLDDEVQENYYRDRLKVWQNLLDERTDLNKDKARKLGIAQTLLAIGMLGASVLLFASIRSMLL